MEARKLPIDYIISKLDELPTLPTIVHELSQTINDPMSSTSDVEKLMANDQSMTTKVLRLVNSAYYAIPGGVTSLGRAIAYLGFDTVNQLVLSASILQALDVKGPPYFNLPEFWKHSIGVAVASETIAKFVRHPVPADMFTCGLVHDMGKIALYTIDAEVIQSIIQVADEKKISFLDAENEVGQPRHTTIGQMLAHKWNLPINVQNVIKYHHSKDFNQRGPLTDDFQRNVDIVYLANLLTHALKFGNSGHGKILGAPKDVLERLTIEPGEGLKKVLQDIKVALDRSSEFIKLLGTQ
ncbi:MAG: HDOD domain-containing protein [Bdellovibrionales bacterium]